MRLNGQQVEGIGTRPLDASTMLLAVRGDVDRRVALAIQRAIGAAVRLGHRRAIVDLTEAVVVQPGVAAALLFARRRLLTIGGDLTVVARGTPFGEASPLRLAPSLDAALAPPSFGSTRRAVVACVAPMRRALTRWAVDAGADERTEQAVAIAGSEAITNAVVHAYRDAPAPGTVSVAGELRTLDHLHVTVSDHGSGLTPRADSPGLGLGLTLIVELCESLTIESQPDEGTCVSMDFELLSGR